MFLGIKEFEIRVLLVDSRWGRVKALVQMEAPGGNYRGSSEIGNGNSRRYGMQLSASNIIQAPLSALLEYSGLLRGRSSHQETESLIYGSGFRDRVEESAPVSNGGEVSIRIIGAGEQENERVGAGLASLAVGPVRDNEASVQQIAGQGMGLGPMGGIRLIRDTIFSRLPGGLSRCFLSLCCCWWFSSGNICKDSLLLFGYPL